MAKQHDQLLYGSLAHVGLTALSSQTTWTPNVDVYECFDMLVVRMELAGINKEDIEITLNERLLLVRGHRKDPCRTNRCKFRQMEIDYGYFERRIVIPRSVDGNQVRAQVQNGFLQIELPKAQSSAHTAVTVIIEQSS